VNTELAYRLYIDRDTLDFIRKNVLRLNIGRRQLDLHHNDNRHITSRFAANLAKPDSNPDDVGFGQQLRFVGLLDGSGTFQLRLECSLWIAHISTSRALSTSSIGLKIVAWSDPANSRPTAFIESPATSSDPESPGDDMGLLMIWPSNRARREVP